MSSSDGSNEDEVTQLKRQLEEERAAFQAFQEKTKKDLELIREATQGMKSSTSSSSTIPAPPTATGKDSNLLCAKHVRRYL